MRVGERTAQIQAGKVVNPMKKAAFGIAGVVLLTLMLAAVGGVALASGEAPATSAVSEVQVSSDADIVSSEPDEVVNEAQSEIVVEVVHSPAVVDVSDVVLSDDDPGDEHPGVKHDEGDHAGGGCGGYADPEKFAAKVEVAAEILGMTSDEIVSHVQAGKRLYQIAAEQGVDVNAFKDAVHAAVNQDDGCDCGSH
jgi:hypothetical protein